MFEVQFENEKQLIRVELFNYKCKKAEHKSWGNTKTQEMCIFTKLYSVISILSFLLVLWQRRNSLKA